MALSLDEVVFGIYDAYKITEDEQIKQGILKKRVNPQDFSASIKDQLRGLTDDELISVSELLKTTFKDSNIKDYVQNNNGAVSIAIPKRIIQEGIELSKDRKRGVSGVSLEQATSLPETIIKTAGVLSLAELYQQFVKSEDLQKLYEGMDKETADMIADSSNATKIAIKAGILTPDKPELIKKEFETNAINGIFTFEEFNEFSPEDQISLLYASDVVASVFLDFKEGMKDGTIYNYDDIIDYYSQTSNARSKHGFQA